MADCTLIILTYKGLEHLKLLLPTVRAAIANSPDYQIEVQIVDNGPDDGTPAFVQAHFPEFDHHFAAANDYLFSYNLSVARANSPFVFLSDNDMRFHPEVFNETLGIIRADERLFAVTCNVMDWEGTTTTAGVRVAQYKAGWLDNHFVTPDAETVRYTMYAGGGAAVFRTKTFNALGGFDPLFRPAYSEDKDIGYRAWQAGYQIVYAPKAVLYHREGGTFKEGQTHNPKRTQLIYRNNILWMLKNVRFPGFLTAFFARLPYRIWLHRRRDTDIYHALLQAVPLMGKALRARRRVATPLVPDAHIISHFNQPYSVHEFSR